MCRPAQRFPAHGLCSALRSELSPLPGEALAGIPVTNTSWRHGSVRNLFQTRFEVLSVLRMQISFLETGAAGRLLSAGKCF